MGLEKARTCKENVHKKIPSTGSTSFKRKEKRREKYNNNDLLEHRLIE